MSILVVASSKGGSGKTTLATNIAVTRANSGRSVLLIDGDAQSSSIGFTELRSDTFDNVGYTAVKLEDKLLRRQAPAMAANYDDTIVDVGGRVNVSLGAALLVAHTVLIPVQPRTYDMLALEQMLELVAEFKEGNPNNLRIAAVLNAADPAGRDNEEALDYLRSLKTIEVLNVTIGRRKAFSNSAATGRAVSEYLPRDNKAIEEINQLIKEIYQ
jgi:chromosome partitioning protein